MPTPYEPGTEVRVVRAFPANFFEGLSDPPLVLEAGDQLAVLPEKGSGNWPAFVLVENESKERGWVPRRYLRLEGKEAVAETAYDTTTLNPALGDVLVVVEADDESGWLWCRDAHDRLGWFPTSHVGPRA